MPQNEFFRIGLQRYIFFLNLQIFPTLFLRKFYNYLNLAEVYPKNLGAHKYEYTRYWIFMSSKVNKTLTLECYTKFKAEIIDTFDIECLVSVCSITIVCRNLESKICCFEWEECHSDLWRHIESPIIVSAHKG